MPQQPNYLLRALLVSIVVNSAVSLTAAGKSATDPVPSAQSPVGYSNCSRIIIFMAIVILELIAAKHKHTYTHRGTIIRWRRSEQVLKGFGVLSPLGSTELSWVQDGSFV